MGENKIRDGRTFVKKKVIRHPDDANSATKADELNHSTRSYEQDTFPVWGNRPGHKRGLLQVSYSVRHFSRPSG